LRRFFAYYGPHKGYFILDLVCASMVAAVDVAFPLVTQYILRTLLPAMALNSALVRTFVVLIGCLIAAYVLRAVLQFIVGYWGHRLGTFIEADMRREIVSCEEAIASLTESPVRFIRPPEGEMSDTVRQVAGSLNYRIVLWDVDTRDWAHTPPDAIARHILDTVQAGDIILMHDFIGYNSPTPEALRTVIPALLERGYRFVTVGELAGG
jgi:hypothetical protein